jgi:hypothetical protein
MAQVAAEEEKDLEGAVVHRLSGLVEEAAVIERQPEAARPFQLEEGQRQKLGRS